MAASRRDRPNIFWFMSEDCSPPGPAYGDSSTTTPTIERLAREGVLFEHAFCTVPVCAPSRFSILTGMYSTSCGPAHNMEAVAHLPEAVKTYPELAHANGYYCTNNSKTHYNCDVDPSLIWDESGPTAHWRDRPEGAPFLAVFNCLETHESAIFEAGHDDGDDDAHPLPAYLPDDAALRRDRGRLRHAVERMDRAFGALLAELEDDGLAEDTVVIYASDHGGSLPRSKRFCYDEGLRVPLIVRIPRRWAHLSRWGPGSRVTEAVSLIDIAPTVVTLTGGTPPPTMAGQALFGTGTAPLCDYAFGSRDRMDERHDMVRTVRDARFRYIRNYRPDRIYGQHYAYAWMAQGYQAWERAHGAGTLNATQDAFWHPKPSEELYDVTLDPDQVVNLASSADHADELHRLRRALDSHLVACVDNGFLPEEHHLQGLSPNGEPPDLPITDLVAIAWTAARREARHLPSLIRSADDDRDYIRYWAAIGMSMLPADQLDGEAVRALDRLMTDRCASVRIEAAEAAARTSSATLAVRVLGEELGHSRTHLTHLRALNALTAIGSPAAAHLDRVTALIDADDKYVRRAARYLRLRLMGEYTPESEIFARDQYRD